MTWKLWDEDGTWLTMLQGEQGVMTMDGSDGEDEEDHADTLASDGDLVHYENQQFLDMENEMFHLRKCGLIK